MNELEKKAQERFFQWVAKCCALLGKPPEWGANLMPSEDPSWFFCYDDKMTPEEAVAKYRATHPEEKKQDG